MRSPPPQLAPERLADVLAEGWGLRAVSLQYVPEGGGSHHWTLTDSAGQRYFVTVDDLDNKDWIGGSRDAVFDGLRCALSTAAALRYDAGLRFVMAPIAACDGLPLRWVDGPYTASVFQFLTGRSHPFGPYTDARLRNQVLDMIAVLHQAGGARRRAPSCPPVRRPGRSGRVSSQPGSALGQRACRRSSTRFATALRRGSRADRHDV